MQPHYSQSSRENATASSGTSPLLGITPPPPPRGGLINEGAAKLQSTEGLSSPCCCLMCFLIEDLGPYS